MEDKDFALAMSQKLSQATMSTEPSLCDKCSSIDFWEKDFVIQDRREELRARVSCDFCKLRYGACTKVPETPRSDDVRFNISLARSALMLNNQLSPALTICGTEGIVIVSTLFDYSDGLTFLTLIELKAKIPEIQIGIPRLPDGKDRFEICRQWFENCDTHNSCKLEDRFNQIRNGRPTRLLDVGKEEAPQLYLYETKEGDVDLKYLALSHPWGNDKEHHFKTTPENYESHKKGISETNLPNLFKDAIELTRALRCRYIWIDSLCIKQGEGGDFESEATRMGLVYSKAYCVIATTHAKGNSDRFLTRESNRESVKLVDKDNIPFYVCEPIDDFQKHVLDGYLNTRGWVLQERALARRTIHFAKEQMYWECGEGIRCETLRKMKK